MPIGPDNRIEPGGPDFGQPTHFLSGRQWGMFAITVPKDFGTKKLTWTLTANGHTSTVSFWTNPPYWIDFYKNGANGNEPPRIKFTPDRPRVDRPAAREVRADADRHGRHSRSSSPRGPRISRRRSCSRLKAAAAAAAAAAAGTARSRPRNEPLPAIIGGRVICGTPAAPAVAAVPPRRPRARSAATSRCCGRSIAGRAT